MLQLKPKPCKGTNQAKGHGCGEMQLYRTYGLGRNCGCYSKWLLNTEAGQEKILKAQIKVSKPRRELEAREKEIKESKKLFSLLQTLKQNCHTYIRLRDKGKPCISCDTPYNDTFQATHFYKSELYSNLRFNEMNIHGGCQKCNLFKDGNESGYRVGFLKRFGADQLQKIDEIALSYKQESFKWNRSELTELNKYYCRKIKELKNL